MVSLTFSLNHFSSIQITGSNTIMYSQPSSEEFNGLHTKTLHGLGSSKNSNIFKLLRKISFPGLISKILVLQVSEDGDFTLFQATEFKNFNHFKQILGLAIVPRISCTQCEHC